MNRLSIKWMVVPLVVVAAAVAGCGGSSGTGTSTEASAGSTTPASTKSSAAVTIGSYKTPEDGTLITGAENRTLYVFKPDEKSTPGHEKSSTCYGACAEVWPPVLSSGTPAVTGQAKASLIGLTTRSDGTKQVTYNGLPLYYYTADAKAGQSVGNHLKDGFGLWVGMLPSGKLAPDGAD